MAVPEPPGQVLALVLGSDATVVAACTQSILSTHTSPCFSTKEDLLVSHLLNVRAAFVCASFVEGGKVVT